MHLQVKALQKKNNHERSDYICDIISLSKIVAKYKVIKRVLHFACPSIYLHLIFTILQLEISSLMN